MLFVITKPDVFKSPNSDTYIIFGEVSFHYISFLFYLHLINTPLISTLCNALATTLMPILPLHCQNIFHAYQHHTHTASANILPNTQHPQHPSTPSNPNLLPH